MELKIYQRDDEHDAEIHFEFAVSNPDVLHGPVFTLRGMERDGEMYARDGRTEIQMGGLAFYAFLLGIIDNPAIVAAIRAEYQQVQVDAAYEAEGKD